MIEIPAISKERLRVRVSAPVTLTDQTIRFAFLTDAEASPGADDWYAAQWLGAAGTSRVAALMLGPAARPLLAGDYKGWLTIAAGDEEPVRPFGWISIV